MKHFNKPDNSNSDPRKPSSQYNPQSISAPHHSNFYQPYHFQGNPQPISAPHYPCYPYQPPPLRSNFNQIPSLHNNNNSMSFHSHINPMPYGPYDYNLSSSYPNPHSFTRPAPPVSKPQNPPPKPSLHFNNGSPSQKNHKSVSLQPSQDTLSLASNISLPHCSKASLAQRTHTIPVPRHNKFSEKKDNQSFSSVSRSRSKEFEKTSFKETWNITVSKTVKVHSKSRDLKSIESLNDLETVIKEEEEEGEVIREGMEKNQVEEKITQEKKTLGTEKKQINKQKLEEPKKFSVNEIRRLINEAQIEEGEIIKSSSGKGIDLMFPDVFNTIVEKIATRIGEGLRASMGNEISQDISSVKQKEKPEEVKEESVKEEKKWKKTRRGKRKKKNNKEVVVFEDDTEEKEEGQVEEAEYLKPTRSSTKNEQNIVREKFETRANEYQQTNGNEMQEDETEETVPNYRFAEYISDSLSSFYKETPSSENLEKLENQQDGHMDKKYDVKENTSYAGLNEKSDKLNLMFNLDGILLSFHTLPKRFNMELIEESKKTCPSELRRIIDKNETEVDVVFRPYTLQFLQRVSQYYNIYVYSSVEYQETQKILDNIDRDRKFIERDYIFKNSIDLAKFASKLFSNLKFNPLQIKKTLILDDQRLVWQEDSHKVISVRKFIPLKKFVNEEQYNKYTLSSDKDGQLQSLSKRDLVCHSESEVCHQLEFLSTFLEDIANQYQNALKGYKDPDFLPSIEVLCEEKLKTILKGIKLAVVSANKSRSEMFEELAIRLGADIVQIEYAHCVVADDVEDLEESDAEKIRMLVDKHPLLSVLSPVWLTECLFSFTRVNTLKFKITDTFTTDLYEVMSDL